MLDVFDETPVNIQVFNNEQFGSIRTTGTADNPLFCATDIAKSLGYANPAKAIIDHCDEGDVIKIYITTTGGVQRMNFLTEPGLYVLLLRSRLDKAAKFKNWVTRDVLPSIRRTRSYSLN